MQYHASHEESVAIDVAGDTAVLAGRNRVTATIYGSRSTWRLQLTMRFAKRRGAWTITHCRATTY